MIVIEDLANDLIRVEDGLWVSRNQSWVSYPQDGNVTCYAVEDSSFWFQHRNRCILELVRSYPPGGTVFDVGGGNGFVSQALIKAGIDTVLVEPGAAGVAHAKASGIPVIIHSTLEGAGFKSHSIPAIGLFDVLEHIQDDTGFLASLRDHLIPKGRLYITVPAYRRLWSVADDDAGHYHRYTLKSLTAKLADAKLCVDYSTYIFVLLVVPILIFRSLPSQLGVRKRQPIETYRGEFTRQETWVNRVLDWVNGIELAALRGKRGLPLGASCLVVARTAG